jgi:hypothetical protein
VGVAETGGPGVAEALASLPGVLRVDATPVDGRVRVQLEASGESELRPVIFGLARERSWVLWELHREHASLEQLFRELTREGAGVEGAGAVTVVDPRDPPAVLDAGAEGDTTR